MAAEAASRVCRPDPYHWLRCRGAGSPERHAEALSIYEQLQALTEAHRGADEQTAAALSTLSEVRPWFRPCGITLLACC